MNHQAEPNPIPETHENTNPTMAEGNKKDNPLSVRIDPHYKEKFELLTQELGLSKKMMLENMIAGYIEKEQQTQRESQLNFSSEIALIASGLDEILTIFTQITVRSQDTVGSLKSSLEQKIANLETQLQTRDAKIQALEEKQQLANATAQTLQLEKEKLERLLAEIKEALAAKEAELLALQYKNLELLEQLNLQRKVERENHILHTETEKAVTEIKRLREALEELQTTNSQGQKKIAHLEATLAETQTGQVETFRQLENRIRHEAELDKKTALLQFQSEYNNLQAENLRNLGEINRKTEELIALKARLAEPEKT